eukprot:1160605-Pelagomonas_calceolata.AAC.3
MKFELVNNCDAAGLGAGLHQLWRPPPVVSLCPDNATKPVSSCHHDSLSCINSPGHKRKTLFHAGASTSNMPHSPQDHTKPKMSTEHEHMDMASSKQQPPIEEYEFPQIKKAAGSKNAPSFLHPLQQKKNEIAQERYGKPYDELTSNEQKSVGACDIVAVGKDYVSYRG